MWSVSFEVRHPRFVSNKSHYKVYAYSYTGLFKMIVGVLTTCHTQYT